MKKQVNRLVSDADLIIYDKKSKKIKEYKNEEDAQAVELQNYIKENGPEAAVVKYIGLKPEDRMTKVIVEEYKKLK